MAYYPNDILTPHFLTGAIQQRPTREAIKQSYIGLELLGQKEVPSRRLMWDSIQSENNLAGFYGRKGEPIPGEDLLFSSHFANMIDMMATRHLDEEIVDSVRAPGMSAVFSEGGSAFPIQGIRQRFDDHVRSRLAWCDDAIDAQIEFMIMSALQGALVWPPTTEAGAAITPAMPHWNSDMSLSVTFPLKSGFKQDASTLTGAGSRAATQKVWTATDSNIIKDLEIIAQYMVEEKGINADDMLIIMSRDILSYQAFNTTVLDWIRGKNYESSLAGSSVTTSMLKDFIKTKLGFDIRTYDAQWTYRTDIDGAPPTTNRVRFLPKGKVLILPKSEMSSLGYFANTYHKDGAGDFKTGKWTWLHEDDEPPFQLRLGVGYVGFPVLEQPESIFVLDAYN